MIVLDASAAVEIVEGSLLGQAFSGLMLTDEEVVSVDLLVPELASVMRKQAIRKEIPRASAATLARTAVNLCNRLYDSRDLQGEVINESLRLSHSSYDMFYFVLARRCGATLFTADAKLAKLCLDNGVNAVCQVKV